MKVTIKDIAKKVNVSVSTVSLVLNDRPCRISKTTRAAILKTAEECNYQVNQAARSLVTKSSRIIGIIIPDIENPFFSSLCKHLEEECLKEGYMLIIVNSNDKEEEDLRLLNMLVSRGVDAIFITPSNEALMNDQLLPEALKKLPVPFVQIDRHFDDLNGYSVLFDNKEGACKAVQYLIDNGHKRIGCIGSRTNASHNGSTRVQGYMKALQQVGYPLFDDDIFQGNYRYQDGYEAGLKILESDLSAVFICNDMMTLGFLHCLNDHHKTYPKDFSIVSYDNTINPYMIGVKITTIAQNVSELAEHACALLFKILKKAPIKQKAIQLKPELILGDSVQKK